MHIYPWKSPETKIFREAHETKGDETTEVSLSRSPPYSQMDILPPFGVIMQTTLGGLLRSLLQGSKPVLLPSSDSGAPPELNVPEGLTVPEPLSNSLHSSRIHSRRWSGASSSSNSQSILPQEQSQDQRGLLKSDSLFQLLSKNVKKKMARTMFKGS